jgi:hypothetical protein
MKTYKITMAREETWMVEIEAESEADALIAGESELMSGNGEPIWGEWTAAPEAEEEEEEEGDDD